MPRDHDVRQDPPIQERAGLPVLLEVSGLTKFYPARHNQLGRAADRFAAVSDVSFSLQRGETLALVGESGAGKSTLSRMLLRLIEPDRGTITFDGSDLTALSMRALRKQRARIQMIFQDPYSSFDPKMSIAASVAEPLQLHTPLSYAQRMPAVAELADRVGISADLLDRYPYELSGGQLQRVAIARALATSPDLIVCDEPVAALDVSIRAQILNMLRDIQRQRHIAYVFVTHDLSLVRNIADRVAVMYKAQIVETGPVDDVFDKPAHEYTRALLDAIPVPDPSARTQAKLRVDTRTSAEGTDRGERAPDPVASRGVEDRRLQRGGVPSGMTMFLVRRVAQGAVTAVLVTIAMFVLLALVPGDPASVAAGDFPTPQAIAHARIALKLNESLVHRYQDFLTGVFTGNFGTSVQVRPGATVLSLVGAALPVTVSLVAVAFLFAFALALPAGFLAARRKNSLLDRLLTTLASVGIAVPAFVTAALLIWVLAVQTGIFPTIGFVPLSDDPVSWAEHIALPAFALSLPLAAELARQVRGVLIDTLEQDYIRTAESKGMPRRTVLWRHAVKNAAKPIVPVIGVQIVTVLGGSVIIENMFAMSGIGSLAYQAVLMRDLPLILGLTVVIAFAVIAVNVIVDLIGYVLDPRGRGRG